MVLQPLAPFETRGDPQDPRGGVVETGITVACDTLAVLMRELDNAEENASRAVSDENVRREKERRVELLIERIRQHREQHSECDYKPTVQ